MTDLADIGVDLNGAVSYEEPAERDPRFECPWTGCEFVSGSERGLKRHITMSHKPPADDDDLDGPGEPDDDEIGEPPRPAERPPQPPKASGGVVGRLRDRWRQGKAKSGPAAASKPKAKRQAVSMKNRISTVDDFAMVWRDLGKRLEYSPHYPTGRMLAIQAPGAGVIMDRAVAGTVIDRMVIQPIWRGKDKWEEPFYLIGPPMLTFSVQSLAIKQWQLVQEGRTQEARALQGRMDAGMEMLGWMLRRSMVKLAPAIAEARAREQAENEALREAFPELAELHPEADPIRALISDLFMPPGGYPPPAQAPQEEPENVGHDDGYE